MRRTYIFDDVTKNLIYEHFDGRSSSIKKLSERLEVPRYMICRWARRLGLSVERNWTHEEIVYLERFISLMSIVDIAQKLNRTAVAIRLKAKQLGLNKRSEGYTLESLAEALGSSHHTIKRWIDGGKLNARYRNTERTPDYFYISEASVRAFILQYPLEIHPTDDNWIWLLEVIAGGEKGLGELSSDKERAS